MDCLQLAFDDREVGARLIGLAQSEWIGCMRRVCQMMVAQSLGFEAQYRKVAVLDNTLLCVYSFAHLSRKYCL